MIQMRDWHPEPGDRVHLWWDIALKEDTPPMASPDDEPLQQAAMTYKTVEVVLETTVTDVDGESVTVEFFDSHRAVPRGRAHKPSQNRRPSGGLFPAHLQSPYTSIQDVAEELKQGCGTDA